MPEFDPRRADIVAFLESRAAETCGHVVGNLLDHLNGTYQWLRRWESPSHVCHAGLCHAVYSTHGFATSLLDVTKDREQLARVIGTEAEALVYFFSACDREYLYPRIRESAEVLFRDRFTNTVEAPESTLFASFMELTFANELDIFSRDIEMVRQHGAPFRSLFAKCRRFVSAAAYASFEEVLGSSESAAPSGRSASEETDALHS